MEAYEKGGHAYRATLPTDALKKLRDAMAETERFGLEDARAAQQEIGARVRALLAEHGMPSVAAPGFEAPGVVVSNTDDEDVHTGRAGVDRDRGACAGRSLNDIPQHNYAVSAGGRRAMR